MTGFLEGLQDYYQNSRRMMAICDVEPQDAGPSEAEIKQADMEVDAERWARWDDEAWEATMDQWETDRDRFVDDHPTPASRRAWWLKHGDPDEV